MSDRIPDDPRFDSIEALRAIGFEGFERVADLMEGGCQAVPVTRGVYVAARATSTPPQFLERNAGGWFRNQDPSVSVATLAEHWVDGAAALYIGRARGPGVRHLLQQRVKRYMRFGNGRRVDHWGGRTLWQLRDHAELRVGWLPTPGDDPAALEARLLSAFVAQFGRLPFANLRGESEP